MKDDFPNGCAHVVVPQADGRDHEVRGQVGVGPDDGVPDADLMAENGVLPDEGVGDLAPEADRDAGGEDGALADGRELVDPDPGPDDDTFADDRGGVDLRGGVDPLGHHL
ncbi:hypothetical protein [Streptomyces sp. NPDC101206]|uniref:hypothetical protein n=1 Tax=Streptomyces sp. NPDC101206 TaxID=3366128 RepID=UPI00381787A9